jgi:hypothetical protein
MSATWRKEKSTDEKNEIMKTAAHRSESWCWRQLLSVLSHVLMLVLTQLVCGRPYIPKTDWNTYAGYKWYKVTPVLRTAVGVQDAWIKCILDCEKRSIKAQRGKIRKYRNIKRKGRWKRGGEGSRGDFFPARTKQVSCLTRFYPRQKMELNNKTSSSGRFVHITHWRGRRLSRSLSGREEINATK